MKQLISFVIALTALLGLLNLGSCSSKKAESASGTGRSEKGTQAQDSIVINLVGRDSVSVFDLLKQSHQVKSWSTVEGSFVEQIDSLDGSRNLFWIYSVNDSTPNIASDKYFTHNGDRVKWHLRKMKNPDASQ